ncbi:hypothetical protein AWH48_03275 [Domibacillus aminovorans]|uniref:SLH domain-containing protein n=1 Tax=Domibacillus aminovorans TaxID=29332 RepID=A0A177KQR0_9BACI|nr:S-layer homology domain-containing protein [Domibacillus aminovorans]OAH55713.1 hypothetical protein AWH48_03275 [Domibacillus aminovorans]
MCGRKRSCTDPHKKRPNILILMVDQEMLKVFKTLQQSSSYKNTMQLDGGRTSTVFTDVKAAHGASGYIQSAFESGIIQGFPDGSFKPNEKVIRGQMAIFLSRAFDLTEESAI